MRLSKNNVLFVTHLLDEDDLEKYGRDAPIINSEENKKRINNLKNFLVENILKDTSSIALISSQRKRTINTSTIICQILLNMGFLKKSINTKIDANLNEGDQGVFILPKGYVAGSHFEGLKIANVIYLNETFNLKNSEYKFGSKKGRATIYTELEPYFKTEGESYDSILCRVYNFLIELQKAKTTQVIGGLIIVSHTLICLILKEIILLQKNDFMNIKRGDLGFHLWNQFKKITKEEVHERNTVLDFTFLSDKKFMDKINDELTYIYAK